MKKVLAVLSAFLLTVACTACGGTGTADSGTTPDSGGTSSSGGVPIAVICKSADSYWDAVKKAVEDARTELNLDISYTAPEKEDYEEQIKLINQAVSDGAKVIVLAPVVVDELNDTLQAAHDKGVEIITIDSDVSFADRAAFLGTQNEYAAQSGGQYALKMIEEDTEDENHVVAVLTHDEISQTAIDRRDGFVNCFEGVEGVEMLDSENCHGDTEESKEKIISMVKERKDDGDDSNDIDIVFASNQPTTVGVCQGVESLIADGVIQEGEVQVIGFDYFNGADAYLDNGILAGVVTQNPYNMGYFGVQAASYLLNGEAIPATMNDTGSALITKENINDDDIQFMINPAGK